MTTPRKIASIVAVSAWSVVLGASLITAPSAGAVARIDHGGSVASLTAHASSVVTDDDGDDSFESLDEDSDDEFDDDLDDDGILNTSSRELDIDGDGLLDTSSREKDIDGDGISNHRDGNIDGDSLVNGKDRDEDGDGVRNALDPRPKGA